MTRKLLARFDIHTRLEPYHAKNLDRRTPEVVSRIAEGRVVALVSDAGTPGVSDPGRTLSTRASTRGSPSRCSRVRAPSSPRSSRAACRRTPSTSADSCPARQGTGAARSRSSPPSTPRSCSTSRRGGSRRRWRASPRRSRGGAAAMARELTKIHEEVVRGDVDHLAEALADRELKGEVVLLVGPPCARERADARAVDPDDGEGARRRPDRGRGEPQGRRAHRRHGDGPAAQRGLRRGARAPFLRRLNARDPAGAGSREGPLRRASATGALPPRRSRRTRRGR